MDVETLVSVARIVAAGIEVVIVHLQAFLPVLWLPTLEIGGKLRVLFQTVLGELAVLLGYRGWLGLRLLHDELCMMV